MAENLGDRKESPEFASCFHLSENPGWPFFGPKMAYVIPPKTKAGSSWLLTIEKQSSYYLDGAFEGQTGGRQETLRRAV